MVEFRVLRCAHCLTFQVLQVTKSPKWKCKLCGEKQSVLKEYGRGSAADCRRHVQKLNTLRMEIDIAAENNSLDSVCRESHFDGSGLDEINESMPGNRMLKQSKSSHWEAFLEKDDTCESLEITKDKDGTPMPFDGLNEEDICITTDGSMIGSERRQTLKNKRKTYHDRSKWAKTAKYEDHEGNVHLPVDKTNEMNFGSQYKKSSFKQNRNVSSKCGKGATGFTSHIDEVITSPHEYSQSRFNKQNFDNERVQNLKQNIVSFQQDSSSLSTTTRGGKSNLSKTTNKLVDASVKPSKWSGFVTENNDEEEVSDDSCDDDSAYQHFTTEFNSDSVSGSSRALSGMNDNNSGPKSISRWNVFDDEKDSDDSEDFNNDEKGSHDFVSNSRENVCLGVNERPNHFQNNGAEQKSSLSGYFNGSDCSYRPSKFVSSGSNDFDIKSSSNLMHVTDCRSRNSLTQPSMTLTQPQGQGGSGNKSTLFQIGDDEDNESWDLDL